MGSKLEANERHKQMPSDSVAKLIQMRTKVEKQNKKIIEELQDVESLSQHPDEKLREYHKKRKAELTDIVEKNKANIRAINDQIKILSARYN